MPTKPNRKHTTRKSTDAPKASEHSPQKSFKAGDVVRLNSGGPFMTVDCVLDDDNLICTWFAEAAAAFRSVTFAAHTLIKIHEG